MSQVAIITAPQEAESIHDYTPEWKSSREYDPQASLTVCRACEVGIKHLFDGIIKRPKNVLIQLTEIPLEADDGSDTLPAQVYGVCHQPYLPKEGMVPSDLVIDIHIHQGYEAMAETVLHELVHAQQIFTGQLGLSRIGSGENGYLKMWKGRAFSKRLMAYNNWPWEVEARQVAAELLEVLKAEEGVGEEA